MTAPAPLAQAPLADIEGMPVLYDALGAVVHLETLELDDVPLIDDAHARLLDWLGPQLRQTWAPFL